MKARPLMLALLVVGCASKPPPTEATDPTPGVASSQERTTAASPEPELAPEAEPEPEARGDETPTSLPPACDQYLALYETCEPQLQAEIDAGDRRAYAAEKASLEYTAGTPEGAELGEACAAMHDELKPVCGG